MREFLDLFMFPGGSIGVASGSPKNLKVLAHPPKEPFPSLDTYFTPALRKPKSSGYGKATVLGTQALWVDVDVDGSVPTPTLPPTVMVHSGHGYHLYWFLSEPVREMSTIEELNKVLIEDIPESDKACWNVDRLMRVPGTPNTKDPPRLATLLVPDTHHRYSLEDIKVLSSLAKTVKTRIRKGTSGGFPSRSERDWSVVRSLVRAGASDELITYIFEVTPIGDKVAEAHKTYLSRTIEKVREKYKKEPPKGKASHIYANDEKVCYQARAGNNTREVSTFLLDPKLLLSSTSGDPDAVVCDVRSQDGLWQDVAFTRDAFTTVRNFDKQAPIASWQWLGRDSDIRKLLPFLLTQLREQESPVVASVSSLGLHTMGGATYFVGDEHTLTHDEQWTTYEGPVAWLPSRKEHPTLDLLAEAPAPEQLEHLRTVVPALNDPNAIWPLLGWYAASPVKPWLEDQGYRFPILHVTGPRGSGKTTLIQRVMMPLFGQKDPRSYDAGTTRFVSLALLGSTNAVPVAFSEFRYESVERFLRFVLLSYDTGHDPRGRPDQTTVDYPLSAPFSLDGEDLIVDPAARQRIVVAYLRADTIMEGSAANNARYLLQDRMLAGFGGWYVQRLLQKLHTGDLGSYLQTAKATLNKAFPQSLPDRVRNNYTVAYLGAMLWCEAVEAPIPSAEVMRESMKIVHGQEGRGKMLADDMIEDVINAAGQGSARFRWDYDEEEKIFYFHLATAHSWWVESRRRRGRGALERESLVGQLKELGYVIPPENRNNLWQQGVKLPQAVKFGLDVPETLRVRKIEFNF